MTHHHRRSIRLKGYDYTQVGAYFVTICAQNRVCLFGEIAAGEMRLNPAGRMVQTVWEAIPAHYTGVQVDAFVVMPNHIHGIIILVGAGPRACPDMEPRDIGQSRDMGQPRDNMGQPRGVAPTGLSLFDVVHRFKTMTTKRYADGVKHHGWMPFSGRLWQRNYYEHIIRNDESLNRLREYVATNPLRWHLDHENPNHIGSEDEFPF